MDDKTLTLMNKIIDILSKLDYDLTLPDIYFEKVNKAKVKEYIRFVILKNFSSKDLLELNSKIPYIENDPSKVGILTRNNQIINVLLPDLDNILSALIICHELTHYIAYKNKLKSFTYMSLYDELIPINEEFKFLMEFYKDYIEEHRNYRFNEAIKRAHILSQKSTDSTIQNIDENSNTNEVINQLSHIYSFLILLQNNNYRENAILFDQINGSNNPLEYEFHKNGIYLRKSIINELKNRN